MTSPALVVKQVISGGQTGADRGGLLAARRLGLGLGGWCPRGRRAEDGAVPAEWPLRETPSPDYAQRTEWNVRDADATVVLTVGPATGGSRLTVELAARLGRPLLHLDLQALSDGEAATALREWLVSRRVVTLNVAGSRESQVPGIQGRTEDVIQRALRT